MRDAVLASEMHAQECFGCRGKRGSSLCSHVDCCALTLDDASLRDGLLSCAAQATAPATLPAPATAPARATAPHRRRGTSGLSAGGPLGMEALSAAVAGAPHSSAVGGAGWQSSWLTSSKCCLWMDTIPVVSLRASLSGRCQLAILKGKRSSSPWQTMLDAVHTLASSKLVGSTRASPILSTVCACCA